MLTPAAPAPELVQLLPIHHVERDRRPGPVNPNPEQPLTAPPAHARHSDGAVIELGSPDVDNLGPGRPG